MCAASLHRRTSSTQTEGKGLALRAGSVGLECEAGLVAAQTGRGREAKFGPSSRSSRGAPQLRGVRSAAFRRRFGVGGAYVSMRSLRTVNLELVRTRGIRLSN